MKLHEQGSYQYDALHQGKRIQRFWHQQRLAFVREKVQLSKHDVVLDVACGSGIFMQKYAPQVSQYHGIDINKRALEFARGLAQKNNIKNVHFTVGSVEKLPYSPKSFSKIFLFEILEHLHEPEKTLDECLRVLKKGGVLILTTPNYHSFWPVMEWLCDTFHLTARMAGDQHVSRFTPQRLAAMLKDKDVGADIGTFFSFSPFLSLVSSSLAEKLFVRELASTSPRGMLLYAIIHKH